MKTFLVFSTLIICLNAYEYFEPRLRVKFGIGEGIGTKYQYDIPLYLEDAKVQGWNQCSRPDEYLPQLMLYCLEDKALCILYDDTGFIAGLQVAINPDNVSNNPYGWESRGFIKWNTTVNDETVELYAIQQYLVDEVYMAKSWSDRLSSRVWWRTLQAGGVWVVGPDRELYKIPTREDELSKTIYTKQDCFIGMGTHYYYNMSKTTECTAEQIYPWFAMVNQGELIGIGLMIFGSLTVDEQRRNWFENPNVRVVKKIVPNGPDCIYDAVQQVGLITMHIYYIDKSWTLQCK